MSRSEMEIAGGNFSGKSGPKILTFDLETVGQMDSSYGQVVTYAAKFLGDPTVIIKDVRDFPQYVTEPWESTQLLNDLADLIEQADMVVTYYGKDFDWKMLQTPLAKIGRALQPTPHVDLYWIGKMHTKIGRGSLDAALTYMGAPRRLQKFHLPPITWRRAMHGDVASLDLLKKRCGLDTEATEWLYKKWKHLIRTHPRLVVGRELCRVCGGDNFEKRGFIVTSVGIKHQRLLCKKCGHWNTSGKRA